MMGFLNLYLKKILYICRTKINTDRLVEYTKVLGDNNAEGTRQIGSVTYG
jgi:hypothetical protein